MESGYLIISDITGYTEFLTTTELDHGSKAIGMLIETLLARHTPPCKVVKLEGDAIFATINDASSSSSQVVLETVQSLYTTFRLAQEHMSLKSTCECRACRNISNLDLKFFIHHGKYIQQNLGGASELSGPDIILVHRLLKNSVSETTGMKAYALFTEAACARIRNPEFETDLRPHTENYEHLGRIPGSVYDLHSFWAQNSGERQVVVPFDQATTMVSRTIQATPQEIWSVITSPTTRAKLLDATMVTVSGGMPTAIGAGSTFHCHHEAEVTTQYVVGWQPDIQLTTRDRFRLPLVGQASILFSSYIQPEGENSKVRLYTGKLEAAAGRQWLADLLWVVLLRKQFTAMGEEILARLEVLVQPKE